MWRVISWKCQILSSFKTLHSCCTTSSTTLLSPTEIQMKMRQVQYLGTEPSHQSIDNECDSNFFFKIIHSVELWGLHWPYSFALQCWLNFSHFFTQVTCIHLDFCVLAWWHMDKSMLNECRLAKSTQLYTVGLSEVSLNPWYFHIFHTHNRLTLTIYIVVMIKWLIFSSSVLSIPSVSSSCLPPSLFSLSYSRCQKY